jgi:hypothetical protein
MKGILIILMTLFFCNKYSYCQDVITMKNGDEIKVKVLEVNPLDVKYKKNDYLTGPTYSTLKSDIFMIKYQNGAKDVFTEVIEKKETVVQTVNSAKDELYQQGKSDANKYYKGKNSGSDWTAITTILLSPVAGVIPAAACSSTEPADENLSYKNSELMKNPNYSEGYINQAHKIKRKKVWSAFGFASGAWMLLLILLKA